MAAQPESIEALQQSWKKMYQVLLPAAAKADATENKIQHTWPVHIDHCFARIIMDNVVGEGEAPWTSRLKSPGYKNMSKTQLRACVELGSKILKGEEKLCDLNRESLEVREREKRGQVPRANGRQEREVDEAGKRKRQEDDDEVEEDRKFGGRGRKRQQATISKYWAKEQTPPESPITRPDSPRHSASPSPSPSRSPSPTSFLHTPPNLNNWLQKISSTPTLTPFRKRVLTALCQVPPGHYTTYAFLSKHLHSSPRAVGNALRNNPYAPQVPCHRVLATGGGLGGFEGEWGRNGEAGANDGKKRGLLKKEGVVFDGKGKVVGVAWEGFV
ncbi:methylated-DNA-[protein]-cysteine S-methyltransferase [Sclerotinia borealis F-4128]|uniref:Methylated-DNA--protein-cysteine methyltransferase n=1 Tax=Sclerotinia borealis (strain F-4128) TaxID=1432307 RepID=W9BZW1_SCLBF|nr:methylated-DNA-[protein]-cysteine S-methyltransferase [Sclerotinia borealis F-4128]